MEILRAEKLKKVFHMDGQTVEALRGIDLSLEAGDAHVVFGPSGSGKSTLLTLLGGLTTPSGGRVYFKGKSFYDLPRKFQDRLRNEAFGFVFQFHYLISELTALENVLLPARIARRANADAEEKARRLLTSVGLHGRESHRPGELSGGEQQRVAVARALINEPEVLFADEPTGNLDRKTAQGIWEVLWDLSRKQGTTLVIVTHDESLARHADRVLRLKDGKLME